MEMRYLLPLLAFLMVACTKSKIHLKDQPAGGDFEVNSTQGHLQTKTLRGKIVFIYFGFLRCPSVCPLTLQNLTDMSKLLAPAQRENLRVLFISVDGQNDSMETLTKKFKPLGPQFIGATDTDEKVAQIQTLFGGRFSKLDGVIDHTSSVYVVNARGDFVSQLKFNSSAENFRNAFVLANKLPPLKDQPSVPRDPILLGSRMDCDIGQEACTLDLKGEGSVTLSLDPKPVAQSKLLKITLRTNAKDLKPDAIDFEGVTQNMGYIRPTFTKIDEENYKAEVTLPTCELSKMEWRARPLFKKNGEHFLADFRFETSQIATPLAPVQIGDKKIKKSPISIKAH